MQLGPRWMKNKDYLIGEGKNIDVFQTEQKRAATWQLGSAASSQGILREEPHKKEKVFA